MDDSFYELELFFSQSEEIDLYLYDSIDDKPILPLCIDLLESADYEKQSNAVFSLLSYLLQQRNNSKEEFTKDMRDKCDEIMAMWDIHVLINLVSLKLQEMQFDDDNIKLQIDLKASLNLLYIILNMSSDIRIELMESVTRFEGMILSAIKCSMEISCIPIKKFSMLYHAYLKLITDLPKKTMSSKLTKELLDSIQMENPRYKQPAENSVEELYRRLMTKENPLPQVIIVGMLRALLTTCPNSSHGSGIDIDQEWSWSLTYYRENPHIFDQLDMNTTQLAEESTRHKLIAGGYISQCLRMLIECFKANNTVQFSYIWQLLTDANGVLVLLKYLNQDFSVLEYIEPRLFSISQEGYMQQLIETNVMVMMWIIYTTVKHHPERINNCLVAYKAPLIMKRIYSKFENSNDLQFLSLKLLRVQIKFLPKKWKTYASNMKFVSEIYKQLPPVSYDWFWHDEEAENFSFTQEEIRQMNIDYNYFHYWQSFESEGEETGGKQAA